MARAVPNKRNNVKLTSAQASQARAAIKNFLPNIPWPPVTAAAKAQMQAAVASYQEQVNKVQQASAAQLSSGVSGTGTALPPTVTEAASNPQTLPAAQIAVQQNNIGPNGTSLSIAPGTNFGGFIGAEILSKLQAVTPPPPLPKFLPAGTDLNTTSFANAIATMQDTIVALQQFAANPTTLNVGGGPGAGTLEDRAAVKNK